jgi:hypothetical protein
MAATDKPFFCRKTVSPSQARRKTSTIEQQRGALSAAKKILLAR